MAELEITITIEAKKTTAIPNGKMIESIERITINDRMSWLELQELIARLTPKSDIEPPKVNDPTMPS